MKPIYRRLKQLSRRFELEPESEAVRRLRQLMEAGRRRVAERAGDQPEPERYRPEWLRERFRVAFSRG